MESDNQSSNRLEGKVALITGANSGIGKACVELFKKEGAKIIACDITKSNFPSDILSIEADITNKVKVSDLFNRAKKQFNSIDIVVNSAGVTSRNAIPDSEDEDAIWDRVMEVNVKGSYLVSKHAADIMKQNKNGSIINLASIMGIVGYPENLGTPFNPYPTSKGAVIQMTKNLANHMAKNGIRVNCICPGFIETDMTVELTKNPAVNKMIKDLHPMGRLGKPEEIANVALFLASDESSFMTGATVLVDGGYTAK
jgi:NAD(P)-dependent dehydrogenase (short-subunit alcohol dehydrogenase family)